MKSLIKNNHASMGDILLAAGIVLLFILIISAVTQNRYNDFAKQATEKGYTVTKVERLDISMTGTLVFDLDSNSTQFYSKAVELNTTTIYWDTTSGNDLLFVVKNQTVAYNFVP